MPVSTRAMQSGEGTRTTKYSCRLPDYGVLEIRGEDAEQFLQGQFTADVSAVTQTTSRLCAWCTPKGRAIVLGRLLRQDDKFLFVIPAPQIAPCLQRLRLYVLRADVQLEDRTDELAVLGVSTDVLPGFGPSPQQAHPLPAPDHVEHVDELTAMGVSSDPPRALLIVPRVKAAALTDATASGAEENDQDRWVLGDIEAGLPWLAPELTDQFLPQMLNLDALDGVSFTKGCYAGQEIVARTQYLGRLKRRLFKLRAKSEVPAKAGDPVYVHGDSSGRGEHVAGTVLCAAKSDGEWKMLAVLNIEATERPLYLHHVLGAGLEIESLPYTVSKLGD